MLSVILQSGFQSCLNLSTFPFSTDDLCDHIKPFLNLQNRNKWQLTYAIVKSQRMAFIHVKSICEWCNIPAYYLIFANAPELILLICTSQPNPKCRQRLRRSYIWTKNKFSLMLCEHQTCFAFKHHNDDDLLLDKDGWIGKVSLKLFPVKERLMRLRWFPSSFLFLSLSFQILKPALSFHLDKVFWRVNEWRSIAEFMILKSQKTELKSSICFAHILRSKL